MTPAEKIAASIRRLADWYKTNKPSINYVSISANDAAQIRTLWKDEKKRPDVAMAGFMVHGDGHLSWGQWNLREPQEVAK